VANDPGFTWDWQWIYHQLKHKQLSIVPSRNLVTNIGFDSEATHTREMNNPAANIPVHSLSFPIVHTVKLKPSFEFEEYMKWVWCYHKRLPIIFYVKQFVSNFIRSSK
jgi:hypothetical protein